MLDWHQPAHGTFRQSEPGAGCSGEGCGGERRAGHASTVLFTVSRKVTTQTLISVNLKGT